MRWVVYVLLGVNLTLLAWNLYRQGGASHAAIQVATPMPPAGQGGNVSRFPLLSELEPGALRTRSTTVAESDVPQPGAGQGESPANAGPAQAGPADASSVSKDAARCFTVGPLPEDAPLQSIAAWLAERGASVNVRAKERREVVLYWIYFPPQPSFAEANTRMEALLAEGIDDVLVVRKGDMAKAISLGVFSRTDTRDRRLKELNARGHQPSVAPRYRVRAASWVDVRAAPDAIDRDALRKAFPRYEQADRPCDVERIAVEQGGSYNPPPSSSAPRPYHFSGQQSAVR